MATKLFFRNTIRNGITDTGDGVVYDLIVGAGASQDTAVVNTAASGTNIQWTKTAGGLSAAWITGRVPAGGVTLTDSDISAWIQESNMNANCGGRYRVYRYQPGPTITELGAGPFNDGIEMSVSPTDLEHLWLGNFTDQAFSENDRILVRLFITNAGTMASGHTCTFKFNAADAATGDSFFNIAETVTFKADPTAADGAASGVASSSVAGAALVLSDGTSAGSAIPASVGAALWITDGLAAGSAVPAAVGADFVTADGTASGIVTVAGSGVAILLAVASSAGLATIDGQGADGAGGSEAQSAGSAAVSGVSSAIAQVQADSAGIGTPLAAGSGLAASVGTVSGIGAALGDSQTVTRVSVDGVAAGVAVLDAVSAAMWAAFYASAGLSTVIGQGDNAAIGGQSLNVVFFVMQMTPTASRILAVTVATDTVAAMSQQVDREVQV